jgi:hypothetical protein
MIGAAERRFSCQTSRGAIFESAPLPLHERWVRKAVAELGGFENVLFQVGNEGFKRFSAVWEVGVYNLVKDELRQRGFSDRLVATNTQDPALESRLDARRAEGHRRRRHRTQGTRLDPIRQAISIASASAPRTPARAPNAGGTT